MLDKEQIQELSVRFEETNPQDAITWAVNTFEKDMAFASSFGMEDICIIDMILRVSPKARIFYLDTSLFFKETYALIQQLENKYTVKFECVVSECPLEQQARQYGDALWKINPDLCCSIRKVAPLKQKLSTLKAWMTGIRREQAPTRAHAKLVEWDEKFNLVKVNPLVKWSSQDVTGYLLKNDIPYNPLHDKGYPSIGCEPCTYPVNPGEDPRAGRWRGFSKTECGLHK